MKNHNAIRCVDEYQCSKCGKAWGINDPDIPDCVDAEPKMTWYEKPRVIEYFGLNVGVPIWCNYLATDRSGSLYAYSTRPLFKNDQFINADMYYQYISRVNLNGINWKETLREI